MLTHGSFRLNTNVEPLGCGLPTPEDFPFIIKLSFSSHCIDLVPKFVISIQSAMAIATVVFIPYFTINADIWTLRSGIVIAPNISTNLLFLLSLSCDCQQFDCILLLIFLRAFGVIFSFRTSKRCFTIICVIVLLFFPFPNHFAHLLVCENHL